ncbi:hypothetical protein DAEQUDRAFT_665528 [Daedalea quercina L-15889]|uniref:F-box domain-containing protein n=1 Tax=Daedalea quercina L-15889 TaxID=1314783 RepID=A0A165SC33_9APHY|nr:hypothetical protein DAEQUDRAFT_665528 [Daedalea quercina L-15889]
MARKKDTLEHGAKGDHAVLTKDGSRKNVRGRRGGLKDMPDMPLDVLLEIFCYMEPRDLLSLARTTKPFREFLMHHSSANMWKAARANIAGLPDCPPYLSEPAFANLAFSPYCHNCLKPNVQTIFWEFSKRYCPSCTKEFTITERQMHHDAQFSWFFLVDDVICSTVSIIDTHCIVPMADWVHPQKSTNGRSELYHRPELDKVRRIWGSLYHTDQWNTFAIEQRLRVQAKNEHATLCRAWDVQRAAKRSEELDHIRQQRFDAIVSKLRDLGWTWAKIRDELVTYMQEIQETRLRAERRRVIWGRLDVLETVISAARAAPPKRTVEDEYKPKLQDLAMMSEVRQLIEAPNDAVVDQQAITDTVVPMLHALEERWQCVRKTDLRAMLNRNIGAQDGVDVLDLATSAFRCKSLRRDLCRRYMHFPEVLAHECPLTFPVTEIQEGDYLSCVVTKYKRHPWSTLNIEVAPCVDEMGMIIARCGKDPETTTLKDMDDIKLVYDTPRVGDLAMTWRSAVR